MLRFNNILAGVVTSLCILQSQFIVLLTCTSKYMMLYIGITMWISAISVAIILLSKSRMRYFIAFIYGVINLIIHIIVTKSDFNVVGNFVTEKYTLATLFSVNPSYFLLFIYLLVFPSLLFVFPIMKRYFKENMQNDNSKEDSVRENTIDYKSLPIWFAFFWAIYEYYAAVPILFNTWDTIRTFFAICFGIFVAYRIKKGDEHCYWVMSAMPFAIVWVSICFILIPIIIPDKVDFNTGLIQIYLSSVNLVLLIPFTILSILSARIRRRHNEKMIISNDMNG
jgi:hypothetical protein